MRLEIWRHALGREGQSVGARWGMCTNKRTGRWWNGATARQSGGKNT